MAQDISSWALTAARNWYENYLSKPHESIGRSGSVCPFVEPSQRADCLRTEEWPVDERAGVDEVVALIERMVERFREIEYPSKNTTLHALVVVLPGLEGERARVLDEAHRIAKPRLVQRGLMLGQFHAKCPDTAARNPNFPVSKSPVPMLAVRHIAFHDVLFLDADPTWFSTYAQRYGRRYTRNAVPEPLFAALFADACRRWENE
jgi:hypothetical protein